VRGLVAGAQATPGSVENLKLINGAQIESGTSNSNSGVGFSIPVVTEMPANNLSVVFRRR